jgi:RimJ/RimL family protein N-acetyltransferase
MAVGIVDGHVLSVNARLAITRRCNSRRLATQLITAPLAKLIGGGPSMEIRALEPDDAPQLIAIRREALSTVPLAFGASLEDDRGLSLETVRTSLADVARFAVLGAFEDGVLVGMVGVSRLDKLKSRHRAKIWGMFVTPPARGRGLGAALLGAAIDHARSWLGVVRVELSVFETAEDARRLYTRTGFHEWGREPRAMQWEGRFVAEHHLFLDLT